MSSDDEINRLAGLCALFGEDSDGDGDRSMDDASHHQAQENKKARTPTTDELLDMSTEPLPDDEPEAELDAEGEGLATLSGSDIPNPQADGNEAEEDSDGRDDHRGSEEDEMPSPPESVTMVDLEVEMDAALVKCQKFLDKAWEQQELYKKLRRSYQRGSKAKKSLKKGNGEAVVVDDPLRKTAQKSRSRTSLKKPLTSAGKPVKPGPSATKDSDSKKVWYNWKKSGLKLRIPRKVLERALRDQVGKAFGDTINWTTIPVHVLMELVCLFYVSLSNRKQIPSLPRWIPDLYEEMSYSDQDLFDRIQVILDSPDSGWAAALTIDGDRMSASINVPDYVKPKQQHKALSNPKPSPTAASNNGRVARPPTDITTAIRLIKRYAETIKIPESLTTKGNTSKAHGKSEGRHARSPSKNGSRSGGSRGSTRSRRGGQRCRSRSPSPRRSRSRSPPRHPRSRVKNPHFSRRNGEFHARKGKR